MQVYRTCCCIRYSRGRLEIDSPCRWINGRNDRSGVRSRASAHVPMTPPVCLTIAGFDPSSGAGITADLKTFAAHGVYGVAAITALTVQSTQGVRALEPIRPSLFRAHLDGLAA